MITIACSKKLEETLGLYQSICEVVFEQFSQINMLYGDKKVTFCLNVHGQGKYFSYPSGQLVSSHEKFQHYLSEEVEDHFVEPLFDENFVNQKLLHTEGVQERIQERQKRIARFDKFVKLARIAIRCLSIVIGTFVLIKIDFRPYSLD